MKELLFVASVDLLHALNMVYDNNKKEASKSSPFLRYREMNGLQNGTAYAASSTHKFQSSSYLDSSNAIAHFSK